MNILNYIAKDIKEGASLNDALAGLQDQAWIIGDTARRMVTNSSPENAQSLDLVISCDENEAAVTLLKADFSAELKNGTYYMQVGPLPVSVRFQDIGEYLATQRYAGSCVAVSLTKKVPITAPEFFFAPPTEEVGGQEGEPTKEQQIELADLVIFEAVLAERMALKMKENINKPMSQVLNENTQAQPVGATD